MECHSHSITILDGRSQTSHPQWCHRRSFNSILLQQPTRLLWVQSEEIIFCHFETTLNDAFQWELAQEDEGYKSGSESLNIPTPLRRPPQIYHISTSGNISFDPTTPLTTATHHPEHSPRRFRNHSSVCCHLMFSSSIKESPTPDSIPLYGRAEQLSLEQHHMDYHHTPTPGTDDSFQDVTAEEEEDFPTDPWDDEILHENPVPDRHSCIHEQSQPHFLCSYPCPYSQDLLPSTPEDTPASCCEMIDLSNISDLPDVITTTSDEDIPALEDIFGL